MTLIRWIGLVSAVMLAGSAVDLSARIAAAAPPLHRQDDAAAADSDRHAPTEPESVAENGDSGKGHAEGEQDEENSGEAPSWVKHENGKSFIELESEAQKRIGLETQPLSAVQARPEVMAYGILEEDPTAAFTLRAPYAGMITPASIAAWPHLGTSVESAHVLGALQVRLTAVERVDLQTRKLEAKAAIAELVADLRSARASYESKYKLNNQGKVVSDRAMEEAEAKVQIDEAKLASARQREALFDKLVGDDEGTIETIPLAAGHRGEVVQLFATPGEAVDSGQALLRVASFDHLIARIELPIGLDTDRLGENAWISLHGDDGQVFEAKRIARAAMAGAQMRGTTFLYSVTVPDDSLRPGMPVVARLSTRDEPIQGVLIPRGALLRFAGSMRVYVQVAEERFEARDVVSAHPMKEGWTALTASLSPGEKVVVKAAQILLSEELKAQIEQEAKAEE